MAFDGRCGLKKTKHVPVGMGQGELKLLSNVQVLVYKTVRAGTCNLGSLLCTAANASVEGCTHPC